MDINPEKYEDYCLSEKGSICPHFGTECVKDPQKCRKWQPFIVHEVHPQLRTVKQKEVYMCLDDIMRMLMNNVVLMMTGQMKVGGPKDMHGFPPPPGGNSSFI